MDEKGKYAPPFSLRFTVEERQRLDADAGDLAIAEYIRSQLFQNPAKRLRPFRRPVQDGKALGEVLAALGRSRLSSNLNQLAKAVHSGSLPVTPETEAAILAAVNEVHDMSDPPPIKESTLNSDSAIHNGLFYWSAQDGEEELFDRADHRFIAAGGGYAVAGQDAGCGHS